MALASGGRTVAVIGTGIDRAYPAQNAALQQEIATKGLVISQFLPGAPPTKTSFPMRNAVMSGYALATVVIEAAYQSGARMQARLALQHGRHVFLMRSLLQHDWARGYAERPGVTVVDNAEHVFDGLQRLAASRRSRQNSCGPDRSWRTVAELSEPYRNHLIPVLPPGHGVCAVCWTAAHPDFRLCYPVQRGP